MAELDEPLGPRLDPRATADERVDAQWRAIGQRLDALPRARAARRAGIGISAALAIAASVFLVVRARSPGTAPLPLASGPVASSSRIALSDGSEVAVDPAGRLLVQKDDPHEVHLALAQGSARFSVAHDVTRPFSVEAREVTVRVVGTEFTVAIESEKEGREFVRVAVDRGVVEVLTRAQPGEVRRLRAGESWSTRTPSIPESDPAPGDASAETRATPPADSAAVPPPPSARGLFEAANQARHAGRVDAAARLYRELLARFPDDPRAKLAAFELGRLELGRGGDAQKALEQAAHGPAGSSVHEDALAKLVAVYDDRGDLVECRRARDQYLAEYPQGIHLAVVRRSCSPP